MSQIRNIMMKDIRKIRSENRLKMTSFLMALSEEIAELATADEIELDGLQKGEMINMRNHIHKEINKIHDKELRDQRTDKEKEKMEKRMEKKIKLHPRDIRLLEASRTGEMGNEIVTFLDRKKDDDTRAKYKLYVDRKTREFERSGKIPMTARTVEPTPPSSERETTTRESETTEIETISEIKPLEPEEPAQKTPSPRAEPTVEPMNIPEKIEMESSSSPTPEEPAQESSEVVVEEPTEVEESPTPEDELAEAEKWYNEECSTYTDGQSTKVPEEEVEEVEEEEEGEEIKEEVEPDEPLKTEVEEIIKDAQEEARTSATPPLPPQTTRPVRPVIPRLRKRPKIQTMPCLRKPGEKDPEASFNQRWNPQKPTLTGQNPISTINKQRKALRNMEKRDLANVKRKRRGSGGNLPSTRITRKAGSKPSSKRHRPGPVPGAVISPKKGSHGY